MNVCIYKRLLQIALKKKEEKSRGKRRKESWVRDRKGGCVCKGKGGGCRKKAKKMADGGATERRMTLLAQSLPKPNRPVFVLAFPFSSTHTKMSY